MWKTTDRYVQQVRLRAAGVGLRGHHCCAWQTLCSFQGDLAQCGDPGAPPPLRQPLLATCWAL